jgi:arsenate reductase-like glutaredoxin family protein
MIPALIALFGLIFGGGNVDYFYLEGFDKGINKYIENKDTKKELKGYVKDYEKAIDEFNKKHKKQMKLFMQKDVDRSTPEEWYKGFFKENLGLRDERQQTAMDFREKVQPKITDDEWKNIVAASEKATKKILEKEQKKEKKQGDKQVDDKLVETSEKYISDEERNQGVSAAYDKFKLAADDLIAAYEKVNAMGNDILVDKNASRSDMQDYADSLNEKRRKMYETFLEFFSELQRITTEEEWQAIMKDFNKAVSKI